MSNSRVQELCDENIQSRSDFRKWAKKNHPDKTSNTNKHVQFIKINNIVNDLLPNNGDSIECKEKSPEKTKVYTNNLPVNLSKAACMRSAENWTKILKHHRFDKSSFNANKLKEDMKTMSPKMVKLIETIKQLDVNDFNNEGKYYKHFIFSDVKKGGHGAKII